MKIALDLPGNRNIVRSYGPGEIRINEESYRASLLLAPDRIEPDWMPAQFDDLQPEHFAAVIAMRPEVVLLGTGARLRFPAARCLAPFAEAQIGVEVMDTGAACRTYNILMGEGRRVVAALLMIEAQRPKAD